MRKLMNKKNGTNVLLKFFTVLTLVLFMGGQAFAADAVVTDQKAKEASSQAAATPVDEAAAAGAGEGSAAAVVAPAVALGITAGTVAIVPIATSIMEGGKTTTTHK